MTRLSRQWLIRHAYARRAAVDSRRRFHLAPLGAIVPAVGGLDQPEFLATAGRPTIFLIHSASWGGAETLSGGGKHRTSPGNDVDPRTAAISRFRRPANTSPHIHSHFSGRERGCVTAPPAPAVRTQ